MDCEYQRPGMVEICYLAKREFPPCPAEIPYKTYRALVRCMRKKMVLKMQYVKESYEFSERMVIPEALVWRDGRWYLAAFCLLRQERRTFRVDRIIKAKKTDIRRKPTGMGKEVKKYGLFPRYRPPFRGFQPC